MKIAVAQLHTSIGPVEGNVGSHLALVDLAVAAEADLIVFPELSLTGYEPTQANELARPVDDACFTPLQAHSDQHRIAIGAGVPIRGAAFPQIAMLLFRPQASVNVHTKSFLHADELPYFSPGITTDTLMWRDPNIALAICYELSVDEHAACAKKAEASIYLASVAKTGRGVDAAHQRLSQLAREQKMLVLFANCIGACDGEHCDGRSAVWGRDGRLLEQLDNQCEGIIVVDDSNETTTVALRS